MIEKTKTSRCIYIQNHQTELDWLFMCYFLQMFGREDDFSAIMKGSIAYNSSWCLRLERCLLSVQLCRISICVSWIVIGQPIKRTSRHFQNDLRPILVLLVYFFVQKARPQFKVISLLCFQFRLLRTLPGLRQTHRKACPGGRRMWVY